MNTVRFSRHGHRLINEELALRCKGLPPERICAFSTELLIATTRDAHNGKQAA
ncbi:hypothetical protein SAMN02800694_2767 [Luteibacter sp. UNCMF331Sha3.1]|uniref:hypothetical protein n=1 Tax=Luteibacter sp. UNCMF331Sha3.1 TaxID=1502760 RepID=UPI0008B31D7E|nr:hypothetical protein [Luteibacter sp. UNCMF331Sha3.1]SEN09913.1 hypothetical protein SAMN02800694_2767 [Luteibacter sp. UNCMF331Sha3.1]